MISSNVLLGDLLEFEQQLHQIHRSIGLIGIASHTQQVVEAKGVASGPVDVLAGGVAVAARDGLLDEVQRHHEGLHLEVGLYYKVKVGEWSNESGKGRENGCRDSFV